MTSPNIYYTIYETTNILNGMKYRGLHRTKNPNDNYLGSGVRMLSAIKKYGKNSFTKVVLFNALDVESMFWAESIFVDREWVSSEMTYNLHIGGSKGSGPKHGFSQIIESRKRHMLEKYGVDSVSKLPEFKEKVRKYILENGSPMSNPIHVETWRAAAKGKHKGEKNSQFGTIWIHNKNLKSNSKLKKNNPILQILLLDCWELGRGKRTGYTFTKFP